MTDKGESGSYEEIQASEIIALIRDGKEVKCHHKIIKGDLDIRKLSEEDKNFFYLRSNFNNIFALHQ